MKHAVGNSKRGTGAEMNESGDAIIFQPCEHADPEQSIGLTEVEALGVEELQVAC